MSPSDRILIIRDGVTFGPYTVADALVYFERALLLEHDLAVEVGVSVSLARPLISVFKETNIKPKREAIWLRFAALVRHNHSMLLPLQSLLSRQWFNDKRTVSLMAVGCTPMVLVVIHSTMVSYVGLAAYFSVLWGVFFFSVFKTQQTVVKDAIRVFFQAPLLAALVVSLTRFIPPFPVFHAWSSSGSFLYRWAGMFLAVAVIEETCKAFPVFLLARHPGRVLQPKTVMLYGIMSGLGFGIWEGVAYQLGINRRQCVDEAYFLNMLRLTSLPFIHAVWSGISSYFVGFSMLLPLHRWSLRVLAVLIPAVLHCIHNSFPGGVSAIIDLFSVALLMMYLSNGQALFSGMKKGGCAVP